MNQLLEQIRSKARVNPPASVTELESLVAIGPLTPELKQLYLDHNGMQPDSKFSLRLMSIAESIEFQPLIFTEQFHSQNVLDEDRAVVVWTDDNSNFACIYLGGPLAGKIFLLDHEEQDTTPAFRSIDSFYSRLLQPEVGWWDWEADFPTVAPDPKDAQDLALADYYWSIFEKCNPHSNRALIAGRRFLALLPFHSSERAEILLTCENGWIQEAACGLLGKRRLIQSAPRLAEVARLGTQNGRIAAILALAKLGTEGRTHLKTLRKELPQGFFAYFPAEL